MSRGVGIVHSNTINCTIVDGLCICRVISRETQAAPVTRLSRLYDASAILAVCPVMDPAPHDPESPALPAAEDPLPPPPPADTPLPPAGDSILSPDSDSDSDSASAEPTAPSEGTASPPSEDDLSTPRASTYRSTEPTDPPDLAAPEENYFPPPLLPRIALEPASASIFSLQNIYSANSSGASTPGLQAKATTAISLPEGVHAQQTDGASSGSVTAAPSFSDSNSIVSLVPTLNTRDNDVESMLGEILSESEGQFSGMGARLAGFGDAHIDDEEWDESSDEEGLEEGMADVSLVWLFWRLLWGDRREY